MTRNKPVDVVQGRFLLIPCFSPPDNRVDMSLGGMDKFSASKDVKHANFIMNFVSPF